MAPTKSYDRWAGEAFTKTEQALVDAALERRVTTAASCSFTDLVNGSDVPRGSAYRSCRDGMVGVMELLHRDTVRTVFRSAFAHLRILSDKDPDAGFTEVVRAGIEGVLVGLTEARWTNEVLWRDRDAVTAYLLRRSEGGIYSRLVEFATWCAANRKADPEKAHRMAETLVWEVLTAAVAALSPDPKKRPNWPANVGPELEKLVVQFATDLGLEDQGAPGPFLPVELFLVERPGQAEPTPQLI